MSAAVTTPVVPPPPASTLDEFSDKLSPMLVKELRQGLRAKTFVILFLALQGLLAVVLLSAVGAASPERAGKTVSTVIFFFFSLAALIAQPLRGIGALHNEIKGNTIDLMVLTRLGAWRIVLGKWIAIVSQTALLLTAIAPYLILRYFFGRMNLFAELHLLALIFLGSAAFTALTVGLSAIPSIIIRGLAPLFLGVFIGSGIFEITFDDDINDLIDFCALQKNGSGWALLMALTFGGYLSWSALALGASMIAPMAENHSTVRRLVALGTALLFGFIAANAKLPSEVAAMMMVLVCTPAVVIALTEPLQLLPPICRPFLRFGGLGKLAGRFFYPGWPAGTLFTGLLVAVAIAILAGIAKWNSTALIRPFEIQMIIALFSGLGTLFMPALILRLLGKRVKQPFTLYLLMLVAVVVVAIAVTLIAKENDYESDDSFMWWFAWIPSVQVPLMGHVEREYYNDFNAFTRASMMPAPGPPDYTPLLITGIVTCAMYYLAIFLFAVRSFGPIREVEAEAALKTAVEP